MAEFLFKLVYSVSKLVDHVKTNLVGVSKLVDHVKTNLVVEREYFSSGNDVKFSNGSSESVPTKNSFKPKSYPCNISVLNVLTDTYRLIEDLSQHV